MFLFLYYRMRIERFIKMKKLINFIDRMNKWIGKTVSFIMFPVTFIVCYEVLMRYLFHRPTIWASEAMVYGCGYLYVLGSAWAMKENRHVKIDFLWEKLSARGKRIIDCITFAFFFLYMAMLLWVGSKFAWESILLGETSGTPWNPPVYPVKIAFVVGVAMLLLQGSAIFIRNLYFVIKGEEL